MAIRLRHPWNIFAIQLGVAMILLIVGITAPIIKARVDCAVQQQVAMGFSSPLAALMDMSQLKPSCKQN